MSKTFVKTAVIIFLISLFIELFVFNGRAFLTMGASNTRQEYIFDGTNLMLNNPSDTSGYLYLDIKSTYENGEQAPVNLSFLLEDEGNTYPYQLSEITIYPTVEKSKYIKLHSYGDVSFLCVTMETDEDAVLEVDGVLWNARVPFFISWLRIALIFALLGMLCILKPSSRIYTYEWKWAQKALPAGALIFVNIIVFFVLARSNTAFVNPVWTHHGQYQRLAQSMAEGRLDIDVGDSELLKSIAELQNPYDSEYRMENVKNAYDVWDTAYYNGKFYVYFGVLPVIVFYLPFYLITHGAFPTWIAVFVCCVAAMGGMYYLVGQICRKWFKELPFAWQLVLSFIASGSISLYCALLRPDFYYLPVVMALALSLWGLGLVFSASLLMEENDEKEDVDKGFEVKVIIRLAGSSLCLALTAGCRPQFLVASFLALMLLVPIMLKNRKKYKSVQIIRRIAFFILPYIIVAVLIMLYNYMRFDSVFDFGANYNLTTNDMTKRGFNLERIPDGIWMYLFKPISISLIFPFVERAQFVSEYLGTTAMDYMYGGVMYTHAILLSIVGIFAVKDRLKEKKALSFTILSILLALVVIIADTEMAGLLNRYYMDFLWLLVLPAVIVLAQTLTSFRGRTMYRYAGWFIIFAGISGCVCEIMTGIDAGELVKNNIYRFYMLKSLFG
jgi:hypothetical protein